MRKYLKIWEFDNVMVIKFKRNKLSNSQISKLVFRQLTSDLCHLLIARFAVPLG